MDELGNLIFKTLLIELSKNLVSGGKLAVQSK